MEFIIKYVLKENIFMSAPKHKIFISYYHKEDEIYKNSLEKILGKEYAVSRSVQIGDIDPQNNTEYIRQLIRDNFLSDSSVTIVLIGNNTWKRKYVDWEIYSSMRSTKKNPRSGVVGIILPTRTDFGKDKAFDKYTIPPRLADNIDNNFVRIYDWSENPNFYMDIIHAAFTRKDRINPNLSRDMFSNNRRDSDERWQ